MQQATEYSTDAHALNVALGEIQSDTENELLQIQILLVFIKRVNWGNVEPGIELKTL